MNQPPFNLDDLIHHRTIEGNRVEFKATWDDHIERAVVASTCAFANDLLNLNGGYIVLGIEDQGGRPVLPPRGLDDLDLDLVQKQIYGACKKIQPDYVPQIYIADYQGRSIAILWAPGGDTRPYRAPDPRQPEQRQYFVRHGSMTVKAEGESFRQLMELAAKIPFDDRRSLRGRIEDLSPALVRRFLHRIGSRLIDADPRVSDEDVYRQLRLTVPINAHEVPRNVALLFFSDDPERDFPGTRIEVVQFRDGAGGDVLDETIFRGPLPDQVGDALRFLRPFCSERVRKVDGRAEAERHFSYPFPAIEEAVVNAAYHRGYDGPPEPIKVYLYPDRIEVISHPGPVPGFRPEHLLPESPKSTAPARNRRIGEFFKDLGSAEARGTGLPKIRRRMAANGSPQPVFDFDFEDRVACRTILPIHAEHLAATVHARLVGLGYGIRPGPDVWLTVEEAMGSWNRLVDQSQRDQFVEHMGREMGGWGRSLRDLPADRPIAAAVVERYLGRFGGIARDSSSAEDGRAPGPSS